MSNGIDIAAIPIGSANITASREQRMKREPTSRPSGRSATNAPLASRCPDSVIAAKGLRQLSHGPDRQAHETESQTPRIIRAPEFPRTSRMGRYDLQRLRRLRERVRRGNRGVVSLEPELGFVTPDAHAYRLPDIGAERARGEGNRAARRQRIPKADFHLRVHVGVGPAAPLFAPRQSLD